MDISFYVLLTIACLVLFLAMWVCASSSTPKWGPDLTLELPPHLLQEVLFRTPKAAENGGAPPIKMMVPTAPSELPYEPLLKNEHCMGMSSPPPPLPARPHRPQHMMMHMDHTIQVLPSTFAPARKLKPVFSTFSTGEPA